MARVIATGGTPAPATSIGQGLGSLGRSLLGMSQLRNERRQRESLNPLAAAVAGRLVGGAQQQAGVVGPQGPQQPTGAASTLAGMDPKQLADVLVQNPALLSDPKGLTELLMGGGPGDLVKGKPGDMFFRPTAAGGLEQVAEVPGEVETMTFGRVVSSSSPLNEAFGLGIPAGEQARVEFQVDPQTNEFKTAVVKGRFGGDSTTISIDQRGEDAFQKEFGKKLAQQLDSAVASGHNASNMEEELVQLTQLLARGVQTGDLQPTITMIQGIADTLGIDTDALVGPLGMHVLGDLRSKEEFERVSTRLIIEGFEKFKGNLNAEEVKLAVDAFANLGRSEKANIDAVAALTASARLARERGLDAINVESRRGARDLMRSRFTTGTERFNELRIQFRDAIEREFNEARELSRMSTFSVEAVAKADMGELMEFVRGLTPEQFQALPQDVINAIDAKLPPLDATSPGGPR